MTSGSMSGSTFSLLIRIEHILRSGAALQQWVVQRTLSPPTGAPVHRRAHPLPRPSTAA